MRNIDTTHRLTDSKRTAVRSQYERDGFIFAPPIIETELIERVRDHVDTLVAAEKRPPSAANALYKLDNRHIADPLIHELASHPAIGEWARALTGAEFVQVFVTQLLIKPSGTEPTVNVGWHQDYQYWHETIEGEVLTAWIAISDVTVDSGPMLLVRGSNRWGLLDAGNFFSGEMDTLKAGIAAAHGSDTWDERPAVLAPGAVSFHDRITVHGSGANTSGLPRKSLAVHLRTERSHLAPGIKCDDVGWLNDFDDPRACPVVYGSK